MKKQNTSAKQRCSKREKQRYPFRRETRIIELLNFNSYGDLKELLEQLKPYLKDEDVYFTTANHLYFDLQKIEGVRVYIYTILNTFFKSIRKKKGLACKQSLFYRYLSDPEHCNLGISERSIKILLNQDVT